MTAQIIYEVAQIFPHYVLKQEGDYIIMRKANFEGQFTDTQELSDLTTADENENYIRLMGYNFEDLVLQAEKFVIFTLSCIKQSKISATCTFLKDFDWNILKIKV